MTPQYQALYDDPEFAELRRRFKRLVFPLIAAGLAWYALYVVFATYAHDFMAEEVLGRINVGLIFGLLQFATTFGIAWVYSRRAEVEIDPRSRALVEKFHLNDGGGAP